MPIASHQQMRSMSPSITASIHSFQVFLTMHLMTNISSFLLKLVSSITGNQRVESRGQCLLPQWGWKKPSRSMGLVRVLWTVPPVPALVTAIGRARVSSTHWGTCPRPYPCPLRWQLLADSCELEPRVRNESLSYFTSFFLCLCFNTRSVCNIFAHTLTLPQLGTFWGGCLRNSEILTTCSRGIPCQLESWAGWNAKCRQEMPKESVSKGKLLPFLPKAKPLAQPWDASATQVGWIPDSECSIYVSDSCRSSQGPEQKPVVTEAHAMLPELVKLRELVCLSDSSVMLLVAVAVQMCPRET